MEQLKSLDELFQMDEKHRLMGAVCGSVPDLEKMHRLLLKENLNREVPDQLRDQFAVAKNMALYTYFFYALAPEVHLKTYTLIEYALRTKVNSKKRLMLRQLIEIAIESGLISDAGFRHLKNPSQDNDWCRSMVDVISSLRNSQAHGSSLLVGDCIHHVRCCADFINQLFPAVDFQKIQHRADGA